MGIMETTILHNLSLNTLYVRTSLRRCTDISVWLQSTALLGASCSRMQLLESWTIRASEQLTYYRILTSCRTTCLLQSSRAQMGTKKREICMFCAAAQRITFPPFEVQAHICKICPRHGRETILIIIFNTIKMMCPVCSLVLNLQAFCKTWYK